MNEMPKALQPAHKPLVEIDRLSVRFGAMSVVKDVSFSVDPGEIVGLVGESGSGKSLTCRAIAGLLSDSARVDGKVSFDGQDISTLTPEQFRLLRGRQISMIFQNPSSHLDPLMTIGGHVAEPLRHHFGQSRWLARQNAIELLESVQIIDPARRVDAYPHELSGGMKQRSLIGAAMACRPRLLLADEPTTALDVTVQARILELLRKLNRERGLSVILVSHDLGVIADICDRVVVMRQGTIVEQGPTREIMRSPRHSYTRLLIDSQPSRLSFGEPARSAAEPLPLIEVDRLSVRFEKPGLLFGGKRGGVIAVDDVSFSIVQGECFGIIGESGSGKSTIARAMTALVEPSAGQIRVEGRALVGLDSKAMAAFRRKVQMVFQNPYDSLNPKMRVLDAIAEPMLRHGIAWRGEALERALRLMEQVDLPPVLGSRYPRQLSGGQCQRVGIARALALDPEVLIADEITSALDVTIQAQILKLLRRLRDERGLTIIYISHDLAVVRRFCDRIAVFSNAKLVEIGPAEKVLEQPTDPYTKLLIASAPRLERALEVRSG